MSMPSSKKISLTTIIDRVLDKENNPYYDSNSKRLRTSFKNLITGLGRDIEDLKDEKGHFSLEESEVPFMTAILRQFLDSNSLISKFAYKHSKSSDFSPVDVHRLIHSILEEANKHGSNAFELQQVAEFFNNVFFGSQLRSYMECHLCIDALYMNLHDLTNAEQVKYLRNVEVILKKEVSLRLAKIAVTAYVRASCKNTDLLHDKQFEFLGHGQNYDEIHNETKHELIQRDKEMLIKIQEDNDLREYIEKKFNKKAEEIFDYATLYEEKVTTEGVT
jgi:hypothetical protein